MLLPSITYNYVKMPHCRWLQQLPAAVKQAGGHGGVCCLFWPAPNAQALDLPYTAEGWLQSWKRSTFARSLQLLLQVGLGRCRSQPQTLIVDVSVCLPPVRCPSAKGEAALLVSSHQRMLFATSQIVVCNVSEGWVALQNLFASMSQPWQSV